MESRERRSEKVYKWLVIRFSGMGSFINPKEKITVDWYDSVVWCTTRGFRCI